MTTDNNQLTAPKPARRTTRELLQSDDFRRQIARALPKHLTADRFLRVALTATLKTPKLLECSQESLFRCLLELSAAGLEPDNRRAYLVPFKNEATLIIGYQGIAELVRRSGEVAKIEAHEVYERDHFDYRFGSRGQLDHKPALRDRGDIIAAYSFVTLKEGVESFDVMGIDDIERIRRRSKTPDAGPWVTDFAEMAKKSVFRRHSKFLPLGSETREWIERDDEFEPATEQEKFAHAQPARVLGGAEVPELPKRPRGRPPKADQWPSKEDQYPDNGTMSPFRGSEPEKPAGPQPVNLLEQVRRELSVEGETEERFLAVLAKNKLNQSGAKELEKVSEADLQIALDNWEGVRQEFSKLQSQDKDSP